jgi:septal ring factor EnvC (AmiA/AmiB activator)
MLTPDEQTEWAKIVKPWRYDPAPQLSRWGRTILAVDLELTALRQQNQCLLGQLATVRDGANAYAESLTHMARENVELHATLARYKAALKAAREHLEAYDAYVARCGERFPAPRHLAERDETTRLTLRAAIAATLGGAATAKVDGETS